VKVYVIAYKVMPDEKTAYDVRFNKEPEWILEYREFAARELDFLRSLQLHVGSHYCELKLEKLGEDKFAIFCGRHPTPE
jgi:hypothetical protein